MKRQLIAAFLMITTTVQFAMAEEVAPPPSSTNASSMWNDLTYRVKSSLIIHASKEDNVESDWRLARTSGAGYGVRYSVSEGNNRYLLAAGVSNIRDPKVGMAVEIHW